MFCGFTRPRYLVSVYRTIGTLASISYVMCMIYVTISFVSVAHGPVGLLRNKLPYLAFQNICHYYSSRFKWSHYILIFIVCSIVVL